MADTRQRTTFGNRFRFLIRAVGLTGVVAVAVGAVLIAVTLPNIDIGTLNGLKAFPDQLRSAGEGNHGDLGKVAAWTLACGVVAVLLALVVEVLSTLFLGVGRRTAAGTVATVGVVAAVALLVLVNVYSFTHYERFDCTRDQRFTLPPELAAELGKLRGNAPTTIVVHQTHNFGPLMPTRDSFTKATEAVVATKVNDLADQFRAFGPQFKVVVLDKEAFEYREQLKELTRDSPELLAAINAAPENSIFFHANKRVQRLSFNEFLQLDRTASDQAEGGRGNLVLLPQGIDTFARRVLAVQERRPKVAVCVVHELLTTVADDPDNRYSLAGVRKSLNDQGFDVVDIVLKKGWPTARSLSDLKPAADTREENKLERLEAELDRANDEVVSARETITVLEAVQKAVNEVKGKPWEDRQALYAKLTGRLYPEEREARLLASLAEQTRQAADELREAGEKKKEAERKLTEAMKDERAIQDRRMTSVEAKFSKQLDDVDLLIIPRVTSENAMRGPGVRASLHGLNREQLKVAKEFMKRGKPVLACLGPITPQVLPRQNESADDFDKRLFVDIAAGSDGFERLLAERGVELGRTVILFDGETKAVGRGDQFGDRPVDVPPLTLAGTADSRLQSNPIADAIRLTGRTAERGLDLKLRALRTVALSPEWQSKQHFVGEFAFTTNDSWSELRPYPIIGELPDGTERAVYVPKYNPTALDDPKKGTRDEEKRGPFPIAVAIENKIPAAWVKEDYERQQAAAALLAPYDGTVAVGLTVAAEKLDRPKQRTVVFGSGNLFNGAELNPPQEKLLLHTVNWLTRREDRLPKADVQPWHYPRVAISDRDRTLWRAGTLFGLPLVVAYVGLIATMRRRMR